MEEARRKTRNGGRNYPNVDQSQRLLVRETWRVGKKRTVVSSHRSGSGGTGGGPFGWPGTGLSSLRGGVLPCSIRQAAFRTTCKAHGRVFTATAAPALAERGVCLKVRIRAYMLKYTHACGMRVQLHTCKSVYMIACMTAYSPQRTHALLHAYMPACLRPCMPAFVHLCMPAYLHACMPTSVRKCICAFVRTKACVLACRHA